MGSLIDRLRRRAPQDSPSLDTSPTVPLLSTEPVDPETEAPVFSDSDGAEDPSLPDSPEVTAAANDTYVEAEFPNGISEQLNKLHTVLTSLADRFDARIRHDGVREQMFNALHAQLKAQEADQSFEVKKNLYRSLMRLHDSLSILQNNVDTESRAAVEDVRQELLDILDSEGVILIEPSDNVFDRKLQQAVEVTPTSDTSQDNTVSDVIRAGFLYGERTLRPQSVIVRKYRPEGQSTPQQGE